MTGEGGILVVQELLEERYKVAICGAIPKF